MHRRAQRGAQTPGRVQSIGVGFDLDWFALGLFRNSPSFGAPYGCRFLAVPAGAPEHVPQRQEGLASLLLMEVAMRRSTVKALGNPEVSRAETHFGIVLALAAFVIAANVCSAILTLVVTP